MICACFHGIWNDLSHFWCKRHEFSICLVHVTLWLSTRDPPRPPASRKTNFEVRKMSLQQSGRSQSWSQWTICFACWQSFARNDPIFAIELRFKDVCKENTGPWMSLETNASFHAAKISGERLLRPTVPCNWPCHTIWLWPQACYKPDSSSSWCPVWHPTCFWCLGRRLTSDAQGVDIGVLVPPYLPLTGKGAGRLWCHFFFVFSCN